MGKYRQALFKHRYDKCSSGPGQIVMRLRSIRSFFGDRSRVHLCTCWSCFCRTSQTEKTSMPVWGHMWEGYSISPTTRRLSHHEASSPIPYGLRGLFGSSQMLHPHKMSLMHAISMSLVGLESLQSSRWESGRLCCCAFIYVSIFTYSLRFKKKFTLCCRKHISRLRTAIAIIVTSFKTRLQYQSIYVDIVFTLLAL